MNLEPYKQIVARVIEKEKKSEKNKKGYYTSSRIRD